jgi:hypothetical protein
MNDLVGKILSVAQEKDRQNGDHNKSGQRRRRGLVDFRRSALDIRAMALEDDSDLLGLLIGPTEVPSDVAGNFSGGDSVRQGGNCRQKLARALAKFRKETVREKHGKGDDSQIGFQNVRASQKKRECRCRNRTIGLIRYANKIENAKMTMTVRAT